MSQHVTHQAHERVLGRGCGDTAVKHNGHGDYLHDGHLHHDHQGPCDQHAIEISAKDPNALTPKHDCQAHAADHQHGPGCGREALPRGDHVDYFAEGIRTATTATITARCPSPEASGSATQARRAASASGMATSTNRARVASAL